ncbi:MAG: IS66 family transposase [Deltaproteobacteria bacterium]|nr:IS66 family transposase [Deltaproteobacteria bacterium]
MPDGYLGYVQSDGYSGYDQLSRKPGIIHLGCLTHARRKFIEVNKGRKARGRKKTSKGLADEALDFIGALYGIEKVARENDLSDEKIRNLRQERAKPVLDRFRTWLDTYPHRFINGYLIGRGKLMLSGSERMLACHCFFFIS